MGGGSQQQPTQTTQYQLSPEQRKLMDLAIPGVTQYAAAGPPKLPDASGIAAFNPTQQAAQSEAVNAAMMQGQTAKTAGDVFQQLPSQVAQSVPGLSPFVGQTQNYEQNPWAGLAQADPAMSSYIAAAQRPLYQNLTEQVLPNVRGGAITAGGFGGSRQGIAEGLAAGKTAQAAGDVGANIAGQQYATNVGALQNRYNTNIGAENARYATNVTGEQNRLQLLQAAKQGDVDALMKLLALAPTVQATQVQPAATLGAVGDVQQQMAQQQLTEQQQRAMYAQVAPFLQSQQILSLLQGLPGGSTVSTGNVPQANKATQALGGAASGAALGTALMPGIGTGIGAVGGAVLPFLMG